MADKEQLDRTKLTFSQAEGLEPLPRRLALREVSKELRAHLWRHLYDELYRASNIDGYLEAPWWKILYDVFVEVNHQPADEFRASLIGTSKWLKQTILDGEWNSVFDLVQFILRHRGCPESMLPEVAEIFERTRAAYTIVPDGPTIVPAATEQEAAAITLSFETLTSEGFDGAKAHLRNAVERFNDGDFSDCVRESIHAVESVARKLDPMASKTLAPALKALEQRILIHTAFKEGLSKIYGYTSDKEGIRHALLEGESDVQEEDALFMIGACASFTTYLIRKARRSGLLNNA